MNDKKKPEELFRPDETSVLKSANSGPQRMSEFVNSAVSDGAVERSEIEIQKNEVYVGEGAQIRPNEVYVGTAPQVTPDEVFVGQGPDPRMPQQQQVEALQDTLAKADAIVESFEQRQAKLAEAYDQAEKMLEEVARIKEALTFDSKLRERIEATIARTKSLRRGVQR